MSVTVYFTNSNGLPKLSSIEPSGPSARCKAEYLDEGGANFVFTLSSNDIPTLPTGISGKLLRVRKNLPHVQTTTEQLRTFEQHFKPLFPAAYLIEHDLLRLGKDLPSLLNEHLLMSTNRPSHRMRDTMALGERYGFLVTDMTPQPGDVLLQLKPKWLAQSPNAPANATRCRTCALRAQRASQQIRTATDKQLSCPLDLVSERINDRKRAAQAVTADTGLHEYLIDEAQPLLQDLRQFQLQLDPRGVLDTSDEAAIFDVCKAMTLRDCTLFVKRSGDDIEARLGDLDLKQPERVGKWKRVEQSLIHDGWYMNKENEQTREKENICLLSR